MKRLENKLGDKPGNANALLSLRAKLKQSERPVAQQKPLTPRSYVKE